MKTLKGCCTLDEACRTRYMPPDVAWHVVVDKRFIAQVHRDANPDAGSLVLFDSTRCMQCIFETPVHVSNSSCIETWEDTVLEFIDNRLKIN